MANQARVLFQGRVQGVWFRAFTSQQAKAARLTGWVRNLPDGSVEALFEGSRGAIEGVIEKCRQGPPSARVDTVEIIWNQANPECHDFAIRP